MSSEEDKQIEKACDSNALSVNGMEWKVKDGDCDLCDHRLSGQLDTSSSASTDGEEREKSKCRRTRFCFSFPLESRDSGQDVEKTSERSHKH